MEDGISRKLGALLLDLDKKVVFGAAGTGLSAVLTSMPALNLLRSTANVSYGDPSASIKTIAVLGAIGAASLITTTVYSGICSGVSNANDIYRARADMRRTAKSPDQREAISNEIGKLALDSKKVKTLRGLVGRVAAGPLGVLFRVSKRYGMSLGQGLVDGSFKDFPDVPPPPRNWVELGG